MAGGVEDRIYERGDDRIHHRFRHAFRPFVCVYGRQHLDLEIAQRQVRAAGDEILSEIPFAVAGPVLVERQRFEEGAADAHGEGALHLADHDLGHQRRTAFENAIGLGDAQRAS